MTLEQFNIFIRDFRKANPDLGLELKVRNEDKEVLVRIMSDDYEVAVITMEFFAEKYAADTGGLLSLKVNYLYDSKDTLISDGEREIVDRFAKELEQASH